MYMVVQQINLDEPAEGQGPFDVILHKMTDLLARPLDNGESAMKQIEMVLVRFCIVIYWYLFFALHFLLTVWLA